MEILSLSEQLELWIKCDAFCDYVLSSESARGCYGVVRFLDAEGEHRYPRSLAIKTLDLEELPKTLRTLEELQREFGKWLKLPPHRNVLTALQLKVADLWLPGHSQGERPRAVSVPVMVMERMNGSLADWIRPEARRSRVEVLIALAQAFNGLAHLYRNGIEGHGDLKPANILFRDVRETFRIPDRCWLSRFPAMIKIADFGWADAWVDYGYTNKAAREFLAPERVGDAATFAPRKSDVFSMGIIACLLMTGKHPARNFKSATKSEGGWYRCCEKGDWNFDGVESEVLTEFVKACLSCDPRLRPSAEEAIAVLCEELRREHRVEIEADLRLWNDEDTDPNFSFVSSVSDEVDRLRATLGLGDHEERRSLARLLEILKGIQVTDLDSLGDWIRTSATIREFVENDDALEAVKILAMTRDGARRHLDDFVSQTDSERLKDLAKLVHENDPVRPFEKFSHHVGHLASLAGVEFEQVLTGEWDLSDLAIGGFAFHQAGRSRSGSDLGTRTWIDFLQIAIDRAPDQSVPFYFRALWSDMAALFLKIGIEVPHLCRSEVLMDLAKACELDGNWREPKALSEKILANPSWPDFEI